MFTLTPQCRTALTTLVALVSIISALLAATVVGVDGRVAQQIAPVREEVATIKTRQQDTLKTLDDIQEDVRWLIREHIMAGNTAR